MSNLADRMQLGLSTRTIWGDPDDDTEPGYEVPQRTVELARQLNDDLFGDVPGYSQGLTGPPMSAADALYQDMGYGSPVIERPVYPGIKELRARMGL